MQRGCLASSPLLGKWGDRNIPPWWSKGGKKSSSLFGYKRGERENFLSPLISAKLARKPEKKQREGEERKKGRRRGEERKKKKESYKGFHLKVSLGFYGSFVLFQGFGWLKHGMCFTYFWRWICDGLM